MAGKSLAQKLLVTSGQRIAVIHAPEGYLALLGDLPAGVTTAAALEGSFDAVQLFVRSQADADAHVPRAIVALKPGGLLWVAYPKKTGKIKTDISRDSGWDAMTAAGWHPVMQIAVDETWSFLRFRPRAEIKVMTRKW